MRLTPMTDEWFTWLAKKQQGYYYPGNRILPMWHGEDNFLELVKAHLKPDLDVFEVGCAQGDLSLFMAPHVRSVLAYDSTPEYIELACKAAAERSIANAKFVVHNARSRYNDGTVRTPAEDHSIDLWVNSKGPFHPIADAPRICRPGAVMLTLVADGGAPGGREPEPWEELLPESLRRLSPPERRDPNWAYKTIAPQLADAGVKLHSWWDIDVTCYTPTPLDFYIGRTWVFDEDEVPPFEEVAPALERIFKEFAEPQGLPGHWCRSIWKAVVPG